MKINTSYVIAGVAFFGIIGWFLINPGKTDEDAPAPKTTRLAQTDIEAVKPTVVVRRVTAEPHDNRLKIFGQTEPNREVQVKAETSGRVVLTPVAEGRPVKRGALLCRQDVDARQANLDQARALLETRRLEFTASKTLVDKGYRSSTQLSTAQAVLDGATAMVKQAEIELDNVNMRAPFAGMFELQQAEVGDYLAPGQPCGTLVELNPLVVSSTLTETQVGQIKIGQTAAIKLATGETVEGNVQLVESRANPSTRTFKIEMAVPNADYALKAGVSADVELLAGQTLAQRIPAGILALNDDGIVGVRYVDAQDQVQFAQVQTIDEDPSGVWVTGLPDDTRVIIQGQDFVAVGTEVDIRSSMTDSANQ